VTVRRLIAALLLVAAAVLQLVAFVHVLRANVAVKEHMGEIGLWVLAPYVLAGGLWLPWRSRLAADGGVVVAGLLLLWTSVESLSIRRHPSLTVSDAAGAAFIGGARRGCLVVLAASLLVFVALARRGMRAPDSEI
jgi:hypothetical protein